MTEAWHRLAAALAPGLLLAAAGCSGDGGTSAGKGGAASATMAHLTVTIRSDNGSHVFHVDQARTPAEQEQGLMYRTDLGANYGMLFWPYPGDGGPPREATFWMKNTPSPLDLIFIRPNRTIARIAENATPNSQELIASGEPVAAVLEIRGGRALELGIDEGDAVAWQ